MVGGSWKHQRVIVVLPAGDMLPSIVALTLWNLAFPPNNGVLKFLAQGTEVGEAYSSAIENVLTDSNIAQWEYVLTVEHDNLPPADGLVRLIDKMEAHPELSAIGGLYFCKGPGGPAQIWGDVKDPVMNFRPQLPDPNGGLVECNGLGMGFTLFRLSMFKDTKLRRPWFKTLRGDNGQGVSTQDLYGWSDFRKFGYRCAVACDVRVGHLDYKGDFGPPGMIW